MPSKPGCILPEVLYTLAELRARTGLGEAAMRTARRNGLREYRAGGRKFVLGRDFIEHVQRNGNGQEGDA